MPQVFCISHIGVSARLNLRSCNRRSLGAEDKVINSEDKISPWSAFGKCRIRVNSLGCRIGQDPGTNARRPAGARTLPRVPPPN